MLASSWNLLTVGYGLQPLLSLLSMCLHSNMRQRQLHTHSQREVETVHARPYSKPVPGSFSIIILLAGDHLAGDITVIRKKENHRLMEVRIEYVVEGNSSFAQLSPRRQSYYHIE